MDMEITVADDIEINSGFVKSDFNCIEEEEEDVHQQEEDQQQENDDNLDMGKKIIPTLIV